jgi:pyruvate dehydrogenase (quinone)
MEKNVAEILVETLIVAGVKPVYGVAGDSLNGLMEAIRRCEKIESIHVRHEEAAAPDSARTSHAFRFPLSARFWISLSHQEPPNST